ncbi:hypothetical protein Pcinc_036749 [Petrolisthes cinctipes]|uniref:Asparagine synthetase domain-containing protein n=1 Tax=Petrolisthes cinctipes TaxID=88211 RepID=A0AAE1BU68_PETCI|nr:hypothetical protein Pcinc_036749 [Petrolisthes cinctipes]
MCGICFVCGVGVSPRQLDKLIEPDWEFLRKRGPDGVAKEYLQINEEIQGVMAGCVLWLQGSSPHTQPIIDRHGNMLLWNGDVLHGHQIPVEMSDTKYLSDQLSNIDDENQLLSLLSDIKGPWSFIYYQTNTKRLYFGRDALGRHSLLWRRPTSHRALFALSSVCHQSQEGGDGVGVEEVPAYGVYRVDLAPEGALTEEGFSVHLFPWSTVNTNTLLLSSYLPSCVLTIQHTIDSCIRVPLNKTLPSHTLTQHLKSTTVVQDPTKDDMMSLYPLVRDPTKSTVVQDPTKDSPMDLCPLVQDPPKFTVVQDPPKDDMMSLYPLVQDPPKDGLMSLYPPKSTVVQDPTKDDIPVMSLKNEQEEVEVSEVRKKKQEVEVTEVRNNGQQQKEDEVTEVRKKKEVEVSEVKNEQQEKEVEITEVRKKKQEQEKEVEVTEVRKKKQEQEKEVEVTEVRKNEQQQQEEKEVEVSEVKKKKEEKEKVEVTEVNEVKNEQQQQQQDEVSDMKFEVPDRISGRQCWRELQQLRPQRTWNFVQIDVTREEVQSARMSTIRHLLHPNTSVLDDSIGCALWFAARGIGTLNGKHYTSPARVVLSGVGADEQLGGYSRHRSAFEAGGWSALINEVETEMTRIHSRNLGRDNRILAHHGRAPRLPYLDEDVVNFLNQLPIWTKANLNLRRGVGEKLLLRVAATHLQLHTPATLPKRAIQFGSRIAKMENTREKGGDVCRRLVKEEEKEEKGDVCV